MLETIRPDGMVAAAWAKGYRLGVIASSDHLSTHMSYAMAWAESAAREGVFEALSRRRAYAATDNIIVAARSGEAFLGEEIRVGGAAPALRAKILGTARLREIAVIRDDQVVCQLRPEGAEADFEFRDAEPAAAESFYYLRAVQSDGEVAWSSPIWVLRDPAAR